ncbi:hypothetical protein AMECASPLE_016449 [Ameca splendens]|uniref:Uncharacterized protein n=1 Tax=Ameca splendens TaxID=208324 RepID=A0ABV0ZMB1_9TELE
MAALTLDLIKLSGPAPADDMDPQANTDWKLYTGLPKLLNRIYFSSLMLSVVSLHLSIPCFFLPLNFPLECLAAALYDDPVSLALPFVAYPCCRVSSSICWTTV